MIARVFIPQITLRFNEQLGMLVPAHNFEPAAQFGQITPVLDDSDDPNLLMHHMHKINKILSDFTHEDMLLAAGDPTVIAACAGLLLRKHKSIIMLKWVKKLKIYVKVEVKP